MKTFDAKLRNAGNDSTYEITVPKEIVSYEKLEAGKIYQFAIIKEGD